MKGIIFTEFMELVEQEFGLEVLENMLDESGSEGIFTAVGSYDHKELVKMIVSLSKLTDVPIEALQEVFGKSVFNNLLNTLPNSAGLKKCANTFQFIRHVEEYIHLEVKKLNGREISVREKSAARNRREKRSRASVGTKSVGTV
jgi:hypothetical protein